MSQKTSPLCLRLGTTYSHDSLIRFLILYSYSDLWIYNCNLDQEKNLTLMVMGHAMVNCIMNLYLLYLNPEPRYQLLSRRVSAGSVIAAGLATSIIGYYDNVTTLDQLLQDNNNISDIDIVVIIGTLVLITLSFIQGFFYNSISVSSTELEAILLIALVGFFFSNSFFSISVDEVENETEIEENDKNLELEEEDLEGTLIGVLINKKTMDEKTGQKILFARIFGHDGNQWKLTPLVVRCRVNFRSWGKTLYDGSYVWLKYNKEEPYFGRYYDIVNADIGFYGSGYPL